MTNGQHMKLGFIGGGNMARAMITGLRAQQFSMSHVTVIDPEAAKRQTLSNEFGVAVSDQLTAIKTCEVIVLAVKPQQLKALALELAGLLSTQLIVSIAAGIRLKDLSRWLGHYQHIVRAMPNTPAQIQQGVTGVYALPAVSQQQIDTANQVLSSTGMTLWVDTEEKLDAVTAISGSGPAYVFFFIESLHQAGLELGLSPQEAQLLAIETFKGASALAAASASPVNELRAQVTSKGGTTEQGILSLQQSAVKEAICKAARQAYLRALSLGDELGHD